jgi:hypothetical protein
MSGGVDCKASLPPEDERPLTVPPESAMDDEPTPAGLTSETVVYPGIAMILRGMLSLAVCKKSRRACVRPHTGKFLLI